MGLPIGGSSEVFIKQLEEKGFVQISTFETMTTLYGKFANEIVELCVLASPKTNTVCKVIVYFPEKDTWSELRKDYFTKKHLYQEKYLIDTSFEFFSDPYDEGDGYELRAIKADKCHYITFFNDIYGKIAVSVDTKPRVKVTYEDPASMKIAQDELKSKAFDDI